MDSFVFDAPIMSLKNSPVNKTLGQYHRLQATVACSSEPTNSYFTNSISLDRQVLVKDDSFWLWRRRNILHHQCFDRNAKPLRGGGAFRKQRNMQWRMVS